MKKKRIITTAALLLVALALILFWRTDSKTKCKMLFRSNEAAFQQAAEAVLSFQPRANVPGVNEVDAWTVLDRDGVRMVEFFIGGSGLVPSSTYWGVYTTTDGQPAGFQGADTPLTPSGDGYSWQEENGDNRYYTESIADGWWYYEASF